MALGAQITENASAAESAADEALFSEEGNVQPVSGGEEDAGQEEGEEEEAPGGGEGGEEGDEGGEEEEEEDETVDEEEEEEDEEEEEEEEEPEKKAKEKKDEDEEEDKAPKKKRIYDETFEKFPKLKSAFDRNKQFSEIFESPDEARQAVTDLARFERMATALESGNPLHVFNALFNKDPKIVAKLAENFIPALLQVHPRLAAKAGIPTFDAILRQARNAAQGLDGRAKDNMENSVDHLCKFIHGKPYTEYMAEKEKEPRGPDPRVVELEREVEAAKDREFRSYYDRAADTCYRRLDRLIATSVSRIPKLSVLERKAITRFTKEDVTEMLDKDKTHSTRMGAIWRRVLQGGLKEEQMSEVINAFLGGAKQLMKPVLAKRLAEARKGRKPSTGGGAGAPPRVPAGGGAQGVSSGKRVGPIDPNKVDYRKTSDMDLFSGNITMKK